MPTRTQVILCWALFAIAMGLMSALAHAIIPPAIGALQSMIGVGFLGALMLVAWLCLAAYGYRPLLHRWLARRRHSRIRQGQ
ncbi:hypothetical protein [Methylobacterium sp. NEAU K]|uniref:hypothetical protein n=1 Tax=Methylobacterium sp. NEAU K TaxID=3064946 RepID=UPI00273501CB|nr:hypothetical protein [Methylobacterium sp. NEAU K]MDP4005058.1 hypothetical protein [Methylobacterium sp. NEAU K]